MKSLARTAGLSPDPQRSAALPGSLYSDPAVFAEEKRRLFYASWQVVAHESELPNPGDYVCASVVDQSLFVLRGHDGVVRAFFNVCQHRAHELLNGKGNVKSVIVCPYHAWSYELDGSLRGARATRHLPEFDPAGIRPGAGADGAAPRPAVRQCRRQRAVARRAGGRHVRRHGARHAVAERGPLQRGIFLQRAAGHAARGQLEGDGRELPRMLPLRPGAQGLCRHDRRRPVRADAPRRLDEKRGAAAQRRQHRLSRAAGRAGAVQRLLAPLPQHRVRRDAGLARAVGVLFRAGQRRADADLLVHAHHAGRDAVRGAAELSRQGAVAGGFRDLRIACIAGSSRLAIARDASSRATSTPASARSTCTPSSAAMRRRWDFECERPGRRNAPAGATVKLVLRASRRFRHRDPCSLPPAAPCAARLRSRDAGTAA